MSIVLGSLLREPKQAIFEGGNNSIMYDSERYGGEMILHVVRRKGSTGSIVVTWVVTSQSSGTIPFSVSPIGGQLSFLEGQWNSSIHLKFGGFPSKMSEVVLSAEFLNVSGGAMLGNLRRVEIVFSAKLHEEPEDSNLLLEMIVPSVLGGVFVIIVIIAAVIFVRRWRR